MADEGEKATLWSTPMGARFSEGPEATLPFAQASAAPSSTGPAQASASHLISSTPAPVPVVPSVGPLTGPAAETALAVPPPAPGASGPASQPSGAASSSSSQITV